MSRMSEPQPGQVPPATRARTSAWRDPRLWVGLLLVAVSVVAGARLLASADDTVAVWSVAADLGRGDPVRAGDLVATRVRFADEDRLADYFVADEQLPPDLQLARGVGAGELLPRAAVGPAADTGIVEVPLAVEAERVPPSVRRGSVVDVHVLPTAGTGTVSGAGSRRPATAGPALAGVPVVDAPALADGFGASGRRQLVVAVEEEEADRFFALLAGTEAPVLTVVRRS